MYTENTGINNENIHPRINGRQNYSEICCDDAQYSDCFVKTLEGSPVEKQVFMTLKKANGVIHERMESAYEAISTKLRRDESNRDSKNEAGDPEKALETIRIDMERAKALCKRNLQTAVDITFRGASSRDA